MDERAPYRFSDLRVPCARCGHEIHEREADHVMEGSGYRCWRCTLSLEAVEPHELALVKAREAKRRVGVGAGLYIGMWILGGLLALLLR